MTRGAAPSDWLPTRDLPSWPGHDAHLTGRRYDCSRPAADVDDQNINTIEHHPLAQTGGGVQIRWLGHVPKASNRQRVVVPAAAPTPLDPKDASSPTGSGPSPGHRDQGRALERPNSSKLRFKAEAVRLAADGSFAQSKLFARVITFPDVRRLYTPRDAPPSTTTSWPVM